MGNDSDGMRLTPSLSGELTEAGVSEKSRESRAQEAGISSVREGGHRGPEAPQPRFQPPAPQIDVLGLIDAWSAGAQHAAEFGDEGDFAHSHMLNPALLTLLGNVRGRRILDAACGQGNLSRMLAQHGAEVVGIEPATGWFDAACAAESRDHLGIAYLQVDLTAPPPAVFTLAPFDAVVLNMVLMDIPDDAAALRTSVTLLRRGGLLLVSLCHPCFEEESDHWNEQGYVAVREYLREYTIPQRIAARIHRPLSHYLNLLADAGCALTQAVEPSLDPAWEHASSFHARNLHVPSFLILAARRLHPGAFA